MVPLSRRPPEDARSTSATTSRRFSVAVRGTLWRWRHVFGILALAAFLLALLDAVRPPDKRDLVVVAARDLVAGQVIADGDVRTAPTDLEIAAALGATSDVVGQTMAVGVGEGTPLVSGMLVGPGLADAAPAGHTVVTVAIADPGSEALSAPGRRVSLIGTSESGLGQVLTNDATVLAHVTAPGSENFLQTVDTLTFLVVAVPRETASVVIEGSATAPVRVSLTSS